MWSLSLPQVAATLAAAMVAFEAKNAQGQRLIDARVLSTVIVLMVVTSTIGPFLTTRIGKREAAVLKVDSTNEASPGRTPLRT
jgi:hypothetical protein